MIGLGSDKYYLSLNFFEHILYDCANIMDGLSNSYTPVPDLKTQNKMRENRPYMPNIVIEL